MTLPVRIKFDELPKSAMPRSSTAKFSDRWQKSIGDEGFLDQVVERWRTSGTSHDDSSNAAMMADALLSDHGDAPYEEPIAQPAQQSMRGSGQYEPAPAYAPAASQGYGNAAPARARESSLRSPSSGQETGYGARDRYAGAAVADAPASRAGGMLRRDTPAPSAGARPAGGMLRREAPAAAEPAAEADQGPALRSLRDRLMQRPR